MRLPLSVAAALPLAWAAVAEPLAPTLWARSVQEDGFVEWATVWALTAAAVVFLRSRPPVESDAWRRLPRVAAAGFCVAVAMEEISWGQRLFGFRPPAYFLAENYQQELNLHNLVDSDWRKAALLAVLALYGVVAPLVGWGWRPAGSVAERWAVPLPGRSAVVPFGLAAIAYGIYPWKFTGEVVELSMGLAFLATAIDPWTRLDPHSGSASRSPRFTLTWIAVVVLLAGASAALSTRARRGAPESLAAARAELAELAEDTRRAASASDTRLAGCGLHQRLYTWVERRDREELREGRFARLQTQGLPAERAAYFLDPWNTAYWIRRTCGARGDRWIVYSFGPNRLRESSGWETAGDDLEAVIEWSTRERDEATAEASDPP